MLEAEQRAKRCTCVGTASLHGHSGLCPFLPRRTVPLPDPYKTPDTLTSPELRLPAENHERIRIYSNAHVSPCLAGIGSVSIRAVEFQLVMPFAEKATSRPYYGETVSRPLSERLNRLSGADSWACYLLRILVRNVDSSAHGRVLVVLPDSLAHPGAQIANPSRSRSRGFTLEENLPYRHCLRITRVNRGMPKSPRPSERLVVRHHSSSGRSSGHCAFCEP